MFYLRSKHWVSKFFQNLFVIRKPNSQKQITLNQKKLIYNNFNQKKKEWHRSYFKRAAGQASNSARMSSTSGSFLSWVTRSANSSSAPGFTRFSRDARGSWRQKANENYHPDHHLIIEIIIMPLVYLPCVIPKALKHLHCIFHVKLGGWITSAKLLDICRILTHFLTKFTDTSLVF